MQKFSLLFTLACAAAAAASVSWAGPIVIGSSTQALAFGSLVAGSGGSVTVAVNPARAQCQRWCHCGAVRQLVRCAVQRDR
ncbi:hypothetical protein LP417_02670 [Polaromonas sp. P1-6]|nr:hypothetical protein LP417_02670 [Polaromonas sp. P1-6]